jgi:adenine-specific DNA-methyltransferase
MDEQLIKKETANIIEENIQKLKSIFPDIFQEGKIDFNKLQQLLGNYIETENERYNFVWNGKSRSLRLAQTPSTGTLLPCKEESKDWESTQNLYIEGDNLEVLKLLQKSYNNKIKMIYIDPPYNTDGDFVYPDSYTDNLQNYLRTTGQIDENGNKLGTNNESNGRYHTDWLNMIYPRLRLARNLLTDDGVIFINIDEHEITNLQKVVCEVFGESNDLGTIVWDKRNPKGDAKGISYQHEYIVVYAKNIDIFLTENRVIRPKKNAIKILNKAEQLYKKITPTYTLEDVNKEFLFWINTQQDFSGGEKAYSKIDEEGNVFQSVSMSWPNKKKAPDDYFIALTHPITKKPCPVPDRGWRNPSNTMQELLYKKLILFGKDESTQPRRKYLLKENMDENITSLLYYGGSDDALLKELDIPFDTPKVVDIVAEHIKSFTKDNDIILDFFSGSATTAHAVMHLNTIDKNSNRKFILVQLPELIEINHEAYKAGYKNISDIGKERIRRAGEKIKNELAAINRQMQLGEEKIDYVDVGFKVLKLDRSNIKKWNPDYDNIENSLIDNIDNYVEGRTELDVVYEIMVKYGLDLSYSVEEIDVSEKKIYSIANGQLIICLDNLITTDIAKYIVGLKKERSIDEMRVVFKDNGFIDDSNKTNVKEILKSGEIKEFITL